MLGGFKAPRSLLKVDILNVMGPAIALTARLWGAGRSRWARAAWLTLATVAVVLVTPWIRTTPLLDQLPDPLEWYVRPPAGQGTFTLFPWAAFVPAGALLGLVIDGAGSTAWWRPVRLQAGILATGLALVALGVWAAEQPAVFPATFWTTSPPTSCCAPDSCSSLSSWRGRGLSGLARPTRHVRWRRSASVAVCLLGARRAGGGVATPPGTP